MQLLNTRIYKSNVDIFGDEKHINITLDGFDELNNKEALSYIKERILDAFDDVENIDDVLQKINIHVSCITK